MRAGKYTCHAGWMPSCHGCHVELNLTSHQVLQARVLADDSLDPTLLMTADRQAIDLEHKRLDVMLDLARVVVELEATAGPVAAR